MAELLAAIGFMVVGAAFAGFIAKKLRQPLIIGYVLAGVLMGPAFLGIVKDAEPILLLAELGIIFLLFIIGIELDLNRVRSVGARSVTIGLIHVVVMTGWGTVVAKLLGMPWMMSLYVGFLVSISSTVVVAKMMQDRRETSSLHGEIIMGILVVEDILAVVGLAVLSTMAQTGPVEVALGFPTLVSVLADFGVQLPSTGIGLGLSLFMQAVIFLAISYVFLVHVAGHLFKAALKFHELFFVLSLALVFIISGLGMFFSFSLAIGAFIAGLALSSAEYSHEVMSRISPLKDFFLILFFVALGMEVVFTDMGSYLIAFWIVLFGAMVLKPVELYFLCKAFGYNVRTSFLVGIHLGQASEFGLILVAGGVVSGAIPFGFLSAAILATIITMVVSTYTIEYEQKLYEKLRPYFVKFSRLKDFDEEIQNIPKKYSPDVVFFGVTPVTSEMISLLHKKDILVVDYNPEQALELEEKNIPTVCSDVIDPELYRTVDFSKVEIVVSVIHDVTAAFQSPSNNRYMIKKILEKNKDAIIVVTAHDDSQAKKFYDAGASIVLTPHLMGRRTLRELLMTKSKTELNRISKSLQLDGKMVISGEIR